MTDNKTKYGRVAVLMGGVSSEREISIMSGSGVLKALLSRGVDAVAVDPAEGLGRLVTEKFDRAYIALHGRFGEDGTIQGVLEYLQIPYTGAGVQASAVAIDKASTRALWATAGLPVARGMVVTSASKAADVLKTLGGDIVVKPSREGSSIGVVRLQNAGIEEIRQALEEALQFDTDVLVEERIYGSELTVSILDGKALPIIDIQAPEGDYDYKNKYWGDAVRYVCPAELAPEVAGRVAAASEKAFAVLGARGWGRIDVMMREDGSFVLLELNTSPGMTPHSLVPMAARAVGLSYEDLVLRVLDAAALDRENAVLKSAKSCED